MKIKYKEFIEDNFSILDKDLQHPVPFVFNAAQSKYMEMLKNEYENMEGVREIILKARQLGWSSFILALFTVDFLINPYSVSICISHRKDSTELLFRKVKFYIESYCQKNGFDSKQLLKSDNKGLIENATNNAIFYILTAGAKVGGRGGSAKNIHFSEAAFFQDTELVTSEEMITATAQQVPQGKGMIFLESTGSSDETYYFKEWGRAYDDHNSTYHPRFFGWQEQYTTEYMEKKSKEFANDFKFRSEYPSDPTEAFLTSGSPYFNNLLLRKMLDEKHEPIEQGRMAANGDWF